MWRNTEGEGKESLNIVVGGGGGFRGWLRGGPPRTYLKEGVGADGLDTKMMDGGLIKNVSRFV